MSITKGTLEENKDYGELSNRINKSINHSINFLNSSYKEALKSDKTKENYLRATYSHRTTRGKYIRWLTCKLFEGCKAEEAIKELVLRHCVREADFNRFNNNFSFVGVQ